MPDGSRRSLLFQTPPDHLGVRQRIHVLEARVDGRDTVLEADEAGPSLRRADEAHPELLLEEARRVDADREQAAAPAHVVDQRVAEPRLEVTPLRHDHERVVVEPAREVVLHQDLERVAPVEQHLAVAAQRVGFAPGRLVDDLRRALEGGRRVEERDLGDRRGPRRVRTPLAHEPPDLRDLGQDPPGDRQVGVLAVVDLEAAARGDGLRRLLQHVDGALGGLPHEGLVEAVDEAPGHQVPRLAVLPALRGEAARLERRGVDGVAARHLAREEVGRRARRAPA